MPQKRTIARVCQTCRASYFVTAQAAVSGLGLYCSRACSGLAQRQQVACTCEHCGGTYFLARSQALRKDGSRSRFCSEECCKRGRRSPVLHCRRCGRQFTLPVSEFGHRGQGKFCSLACKSLTPEARRATWNARPGMLRKFPGHASREQLAGRIAMFGSRCYLCGGKATGIDHLIPLSRGGSNWPANLRPCCQPCNSRKGNKTYFEYVGLPHRSRA